MAVEPPILGVELPASAPARLRSGDHLRNREGEANAEACRLGYAGAHSRLVECDPRNGAQAGGNLLGHAEPTVEADFELGLATDGQNIEELSGGLHCDGAAVEVDDSAGVTDAPDPRWSPITSGKGRDAVREQDWHRGSKRRQDLRIRLLASELPQLSQVHRARLRNSQVEWGCVRLLGTAISVHILGRRLRQLRDDRVLDVLGPAGGGQPSIHVRQPHPSTLLSVALSRVIWIWMFGWQWRV